MTPAERTTDTPPATFPALLPPLPEPVRDARVTANALELIWLTAAPVNDELEETPIAHAA